MSWEDLINGAISPAPTSGGGAAPVGAEPIIQGLIDRGLPQYVAEGFALNMDDESKLNPGINEQNPIVAGSRGGWGLNQWTGPRRRAFEAFAAQQGKPLDDLDTQLDFTVWELANTERAARDKILATNSTGEAAAAIVNHFLRPAAEHRTRRAAKYLKTGATTFSGVKPTYNKLWLEL